MNYRHSYLLAIFILTCLSSQLCVSDTNPEDTNQAVVSISSCDDNIAKLLEISFEDIGAGRFNEASKILTKVVNLDTTNMTAILLRGMVYLEPMKLWLRFQLRMSGLFEDVHRVAYSERSKE